MALFKIQNPLYNPNKSLSFLSTFVKTLTSSASQTKQNNHTKSLVALFQESAGLTENPQNRKGLKELQKAIRDLIPKSTKNEEIRDLELETSQKEHPKVKAKANEIPKSTKYEDIIDLKLKTSKKEYPKAKAKANERKNLKTEETEVVKNLSSLFLDKRAQDEEKKQAKKREEEPTIFKELSPDMELLVSHLCKEGYFNDANFLTSDYKKLDFSWFNNSYARDYIKFAAEKFGKDHQEIAKWLSGSDLKMVAQFGCPSDTKKTVFSAKQLRQFFEIQEDTVCSKCVLKDSCKFENRSGWKGDDKILKLAVVMRVIPLYAFETVHPQLAVPDEVKAAASRLLKEIINLSKTTSISTC